MTTPNTGDPPKCLEELVMANHNVILQRFAALDERVTILSSHSIATSDKLIAHISDEASDLRFMRADLERTLETFSSHVTGVKEEVLSGFPNKDPVKHHDYHAEVIEEKNTWKNRKEKIITAVLEKGSLGVLGVLLLALWYYFLNKAGLPQNDPH